VALVVDASVAAAWLLPDESSEAADGVLHRVAVEGAVAPDLLWHELRDILLTAARRGHLPEAEIVPALLRLRRLPIEAADMAAGGDAALVALAARHRLTGYAAAYLALARDRGVPLAMADRALRRAAEAEGVGAV
jgi:predicted nucleic acid-binding protein